MTGVCRHEGVCGGCGLQLIPYAEQLRLKADAFRRRLPASLRDALAPTFVPVHAAEAPPWHFRQKVAFVFGTDAGGDLTMGHFARGTQRLVPVVECPVHSNRGNRLAFALRDHLRRAGVGAAGPSGRGVLRHLLVRVTEDERAAVAMLVVSENDKRLRKPVRAFLESAERPDGFFVNIHPGGGPYMLGLETLKIDGQRHVRERVGGLSYLLSPDAFFQTNVRAAAALQALVVEWVTRGVAPQRARIFDLYAGSGLFALPLIAAGHQVTAVEENRRAVADAEGNLRLNRLPASRARLLASRVESALEQLTGTPCDAVVMDPPRQGCSPAVLRGVFERLAPACVVYVSCGPDALEAELPEILRCGYRVDDVKLVDMFPHTDHLESVVRLVRREDQR